MNIRINNSLSYFNVFFVILTLISSSGTFSSEKIGIDCYEIPEYFNSYYEAQYIIFNANFNFTDYIDTYESSWIRGAGYLSCDGYYGFLFIETDSRYYVHQNVPVDLWFAFKYANSYGGFYNYYLRYNYHLQLGY